MAVNYLTMKPLIAKTKTLRTESDQLSALASQMANATVKPISLMSALTDINYATHSLKRSRNLLTRQLQEYIQVQSIRIVLFTVEQPPERFERSLGKLASPDTSAFRRKLASHKLIKQGIRHCAYLKGTALDKPIAFLIYHRGDRIFIMQDGDILHRGYRQLYAVAKSPDAARSSLVRLSDQIAARLSDDQLSIICSSPLSDRNDCSISK
jgi:hypothetical protein